MSLYPFTVNGNEYNLSDFENFAYVTGLPASMKDTLLHALLLYTAASSTSNTIGTGTKNFTATAGRAFRPGDDVFIANSASPHTQRMFGQVMSYDFATGALQVNVTGTLGAGTLTTWWIGLGGVSASFSPTEYMLAIDQGGTGYGRDTFVLPANVLGLGDPGCSMMEIYEEFAGSQGNSGSFATTDNTVTAPWHAYNHASVPVFVVPAAGASSAAGAGFFRLRCTTILDRQRTRCSAILQYNDHGFFHVGKGATIWESNVFGIAAATPYSVRMGLKPTSSGLTSDIFKSGGIGFEVSSLANNGRFVIVCGTNGQVKRINTNIVPSSTFNKLRFEVDHDGRQVDYYINGTYVGSIENLCPTLGANNLVCPAYETQALVVDGVVTPTEYFIDSLQLRKYLLR